MMPMALTGKRRAAHQEVIDFTGTLAALANRPDDERLATTHVTIAAVTIFLHRSQAHRALDLGLVLPPQLLAAADELAD